MDKGKIIFENGQSFMPKFPDDTPCQNQAMDKWEDENLPLHERRKPRMLYCGCPKCNRVTL